MPEVAQYKFSFRELAEMMVEKAGVKEGLWGVWVSFGIAASNVGASRDELHPAAIVPLVEVGLQQFKEPGNLTVDAAEVWRKRSKGRTPKPAATPKD
ncbi:MAG TPA: hypothetical protein VJB57_14445 [Dehalococcoidia bacterium]|nr:hypothetical protein [Dehalococcoidia bacterium]